MLAVLLASLSPVRPFLPLNFSPNTYLGYTVSAVSLASTPVLSLGTSAQVQVNETFSASFVVDFNDPASRNKF